MTLLKRLAKSKEKKVGVTLAFDGETTAKMRDTLDNLDRVIANVVNLDKNTTWDLCGDRNLVERYKGIFECLGRK